MLNIVCFKRGRGHSKCPTLASCFSGQYIKQSFKALQWVCMHKPLHDKQSSDEVKTYLSMFKLLIDSVCLGGKQNVCDIT